jgi:tRNA-2-methylthio-N6-dimethylallyladenosine synthase
MSGRARDGRLVHFTPTGPAIEGEIRPGDVVTATITYGAPHHLVADGDLHSHRRTKAGDNWESGIRPKTSGVSLGLPSFGAPQPTTVDTSEGCQVR